LLVLQSNEKEYSMQSLRSTLNKLFGRRMHPKTSVISQKCRISIGAKQLRITGQQLEMARGLHAEVCKVERGLVILEGPQEEIFECVGTLVSYEQEHLAKHEQHVTRGGRRQHRLAG
jgi:hypothetical protein